MAKLRLPVVGYLLVLVAAKLTLATDDIFLQFYMNQVKLWDQQGQQAKLQSAMLTGLREYCSVTANFANCGINSTADVTFTAAAVVISPGYPTDANSRYLDVRIGIEYSVGSTPVRLPAAVVKEIATSRRESLSSSVGYYLVYINKDFYSIPPASLANKVIVPIFVLGTLVLIIVALALRHRQLRERNKRMRSSGSELKPHRKSVGGGDQLTNRGDNKVSAADLKTNDQKQQKKTDSVPLDEQDTGKKKHKKNSKLKSKSKSKAGNKTSEKATPGATIDWSGGGGKKAAGNGEFNNIGFEKSINEGDLRARQSGASHSEHQHQQPLSMINQSASNLSEIIQVRSGAASPMSKGQDKGKKQKTRKRTGDAEEDNLMDNSVFKPPEGNLTDAERELSASEDDGVPTLRDSSDQQMI